MEKLFSNILFPVQLNSQTEGLVEKAVRFANQFQCNLHLLHVIPSSPFEKLKNKICSLLGIRVTHSAAKQKLALLQNKFSGQLNKGLLLIVSAEKGDAKKIIGRYIESHDIDLLLVDEQLRYLPGSIFQQEEETFSARPNYAVLTLTPGLGFKEMKTIVLPVGKNLALNKLRIAAYLASQFDAAIHLVAIEMNDSFTEELPYMKKAFRILKENTHIPVVCKTLNGQDAVATVMQYGRRVHADLLIANPQTLTTWKKLKGKVFNITVRNSKLPVLTVK